MRITRRIAQLAFVAIAAGSGIAIAAGWMTGSIEAFCPMGGLATLPALLVRGRTTCAMGVLNLTMFLALLGLLLISRKSFCSWICPVGTISEWLARLARKLRPSKKARRVPGGDLGLINPPATVDAALRWLRLPALAAIMGATWSSAELIFRPFCPYYVSFSGHGHEVMYWSYGVLAAVLVIALIVPMGFCRYLCPLGVAMWPLSRLGLLRVRRDESACTSCGLCDRACPHGLRVMDVDQVSAGECTMCLECTAVCPEAGALKIAAPKLRRPLSSWLVPASVVVLSLAGYLGSSTLAIASHSVSYDEATGTSATVELTVDGLRCAGTARKLEAHVAGKPGIVSFAAYAPERRVVIIFDPQRTDMAAITAAVEGPRFDKSSGQYLFDGFKVINQRVLPD